MLVINVTMLAVNRRLIVVVLVVFAVMIPTSGTVNMARIHVVLVLVHLVGHIVRLLVLIMVPVPGLFVVMPIHVLIVVSIVLLVVVVRVVVLAAHVVVVC